MPAKLLQKNILIGLIGSSSASAEERYLAHETCRRLAKKGFSIVCGGLSGVMEEGCRGAKSANGLTIGILPGASKNEANPYIDIVIPTGIGEARNLIIIRSSSIVIAIGGGYGTLSEIAFALRLGVPVIGLKTWNINKISNESAKIIEVLTPEEAVKKVIELIKK